ncbi:MAG: hypothetical protein J6Y94_07535, partial [Bacteriovoracaceae bacterium]|nr:hypothetical protein [Bacteriovoracaceae bacterium]
MALDEGAAAANVDAELKVDEDASQADYPNLPDDIYFNQDVDASGAIDIDAELAQSAAEGEYDNFSANDETVSAGDAA